MSKVSTKRLARGVRMLSDHVVGQLRTLLQTPQLAQINTQNLKADKSTFRINLHVPVIKGQDTGATQHLPLYVPFTLPPVQEYFATPTYGTEMPDIDGNYPRAVLTEIGFSFDQRREAAAITRDVGGASPIIEGKLDYEQVGRLGTKVSLYAKDMTHWNPNAPKFLEERLLTFELPALSFSGTRLRLNPTTQSNLRIPVNPLKTYVLEIDCAGLTDAVANPLQLNSVLVSLKFEQQLMGRDVNYPPNVSVQNMPTSHKGQAPTSSANITLPTTASEAIRARSGGTGTGIQTAYETIDGFFQRLLRGGYNDRSGVPETQQLLQDAGYEVIAVPMFGNQEGVYGAAGGAAPVQNGLSVLDMPCGNVTLSGQIYDMRRIPIRYPFVLHHVVAAVNWTPNAKDVDVTVPLTATFSNTIGVGIGCGHHADIAGWDQVAYANWNAGTVNNYRIDQVNRNDGIAQKNLGFDLMSVPLVGSAANSTIGAGYNSNNGKPVFIGSASSPNEDRAALADGVAGAVPGSRPLEGKEQWIEVRWQMIDSSADPYVTSPNWTATDIVIGNGGHWVFLIGKKQLC